MATDQKQMNMKYEDTENNEENYAFSKKYKWYNVNVNILPSKLCYLLEGAKFLGYKPNLVLFLTGIGLSKIESGIIMGFRVLGKLIGGPFWGVIADKWKCHKFVVVMLCLISILSMCSQPFVSMSYGDPEINRCPEPKQQMSTSNPCNNTTLSSQCNSTNGNNQTMSVSSSNETSIGRYGSLFWIIFLLQIAVSFSDGNFEFIDTATLRKSQLSDKRKVEYGKQRMFAPIGGVLGVAISNLAINNFPFKDVTCYAGIFGPFAAFAIVTAIPLLILYKNLDFSNNSDKTISDVEDNKKFRIILFNTLVEKEVLLFLTLTFFSGIFQTPIDFRYLYLKELETPQPVYTLLFAVSELTAFIGYGFSSQLIKLLGGTWKSIAISFLAYGLKHLGYALMTNAWLFVPLEILHFFGFSLFLATGLNHVKHISPAPVITTMVSIFNALILAVGPMVGSSLSGLLYEKYGATILFSRFAIFEFSAGIMVGFLAIFILEKEKKQEEIEMKEIGSSPLLSEQKT